VQLGAPRGGTTDSIPYRVRFPGRMLSRSQPSIAMRIPKPVPAFITPLIGILIGIGIGFLVECSPGRSHRLR
jgi:hypothetical protein